MNDSQICIGCQECCKWTTFTINVENKNSDFWENYYVRRGCKIANYQNSTPGFVQMAVMVPSICPQLSQFGCKIYPDRPVFCRNYDGRRDPLMADKCQLPKK